MVKQTIAAAPTVPTIVARRLGDGVGGGRIGQGLGEMDARGIGSDRLRPLVAIRFIIATASHGYWPDALSADSMIASAPS